jgi:phage terminase large subunit GpA-like protein
VSTDVVYEIKLKPQKSEYRFSDEEWNDMVDAILHAVTSYPKERVTEKVSEWMERKMVLKKGQSVYSGRFSFDVTPYLREIADNLSIGSGITEMAVIKGNQGGFSTISHGHIGYCIDYGIGPGLFVSGDQQMSEDQIEQRVDTVIEEAGLQDKIKATVQKKANKGTGDRKGFKSYGGTFFRAVGPRSEGKLRSFPAMWAHIEEVDVFPIKLGGAHSKGNPIEKTIRRMDTYGPLRRAYYNSTPKEKVSSQIEPLYEAGDKRQYHVPCPHCGHKQPLTWGGFNWDKNPDGSPAVKIDPETGTVLHDPVYYVCAECGAHWKNADKWQFLKDKEAGGMVLPDGRHVWAEWVPTKAPDRPGIRSYKWPSLYSPFRPWLDVVLQFWRVRHDPQLLPDFVNDVLAETWEESVQTPKPEGIQARAEEWEPGYIPRGVLFTTLAADIQADRIEAGLWGWGRNKESWALNYWVFEGTTAEINAPCWNNLEQVLTAEYTREDGVNLGTPMITFIDTRYLPNVVNNFVDRFQYHPRVVDGVYPVRGQETQTEIYKVHKNDIATPVVSIHDQRLKRELYSYLKREAPVEGAAFPYGYIHFPATYDETFYKQLTSEEFVVDRDSRGRERVRIDNIHQRRNEVLDIAKMNLGALHFACLRWFELENKRRRTKHRPEVEVDWGRFWSFFADRE